MAKYETWLRGDFTTLLTQINNGILEGSMSASYEDGSNFASGNLCCAVRVYERYSYAGGNRVSLNITMVGDGHRIFLSAITSGGSQAVFFKLNTWGEESFLDELKNVINSTQRGL